MAVYVHTALYSITVRLVVYFGDRMEALYLLKPRLYFYSLFSICSSRFPFQPSLPRITIKNVSTVNEPSSLQLVSFRLAGLVDLELQRGTNQSLTIFLESNFNVAKRTLPIFCFLDSHDRVLVIFQYLLRFTCGLKIQNSKDLSPFVPKK